MEYRAPFQAVNFLGCLIQWHEKHRAKSSVAPSSPSEFTPAPVAGTLSLDLSVRRHSQPTLRGFSPSKHRVYA